MKASSSIVASAIVASRGAWFRGQQSCPPYMGFDLFRNGAGAGTKRRTPNRKPFERFSPLLGLGVEPPQKTVAREAVGGYNRFVPSLPWERG